MFVPALVLGLFFRLAKRTNSQDISLKVDLGYSQYQGTNAANGVRQWLGIRYAAPPVGDLRFRAAADPLLNNIVQIADAHGPLCHFTPSNTLDPNHSEDCLFLDVYAPTENRTAKLHPVFVFIQGGGFSMLSNPNFNGNSLINAGEHDLVVVTFNYRVGMWGFLASQEVKENGDLNVGLLDQRKVLEWVQNYIHLFGGDPDHVTIGGDSAGAASVELHLTAYGGRDDGLFHAAAAESQSFGALLTVEESQYQYNALIQRVGCAKNTDTLQCLRNTDIAVLTKNNSNIPTPGGAGSPPLFMWGPVIDRNFTTDYSYNLFSQGNFIKVPSIFGDDTNEGTIFTPSNISSVTDMDKFLKDQFANLTQSDLKQINTYFPESQQFSGRGVYWRAAANAYGEIRYICPGIFISTMLSTHGQAASYNYRWDVLSPKNAANGLGVVHTAELQSIWGTSNAPDNVSIPTIQAYWTSFIRTKDPNTYKLKSSPEWMTFNSTGMGRLHFPNDPTNVTMESVPADQRARCAFFQSIGPSAQQ
ncbi:alpha/beta-hydrolase [Hyaloscypha hepaticicola]|uniref:Carboxylic ester hydrolase n=1 Tax=Hyaloscypha hepaticicola TaxID=2082293 RepID=A0A2J6PI38_9HELO|nr:alpha/beta-hydrolase [Hyaloscypha hepaticicola]